MGDVNCSTIEPFDPQTTFRSGQVFRWFRLSQEPIWIGTVEGNIIEVKKSRFELLGSLSEGFDFEHFVEHYFSLQDDLEGIRSTFPKSKYLQSAMLRYPGMRILRQDPFECLISFVCSINKNIPAISGCIERLAHQFGERIPSKRGGKFFSFPTAKKLSKASKHELMHCGVGFRWKYIRFISGKIAEGELDLGWLERLSYSDVRHRLISKLSRVTFGVGPKVCDCVSLYSYHRLEAFPLDVWILRCLKQHFSHALSLGDRDFSLGSLAPASYEKISNSARKYFGEYAGYAQLYLYARIRSDATQSRVPA